MSSIEVMLLIPLELGFTYIISKRLLLKQTSGKDLGIGCDIPRIKSLTVNLRWYLKRTRNILFAVTKFKAIKLCQFVWKRMT